MRKKLTAEKFIKKANQIQLKKKRQYDYSLVEYKNSKSKVKIICPEHGVFEQQPKAHLKGQGCPICGGRKKLNTEEFIRYAKEMHTKYKYDLVEYKNAKTKIKIICPEHGVFEQMPSMHLQGRGCPKCAGNQPLTTSEFIEKAKKIHHGKYDYSLTDYKNNHSKVKIICPEHGVFEQIPNNHLRGVGCCYCAENFKPSLNDFINKAKKKHGDFYFYPEQKYINSHTAIVIICPIHGQFKQTPMTHLQGSGCPTCAKYGFNSAQPATLYYIYDPQEDMYKIGITNHDVQTRFGKDFCSKRAIAILEQWDYEIGEHAQKAEQEVLKAFKDYRTTNPSWPEEVGGKTEFFKIDVLSNLKGK